MGKADTSMIYAIDHVQCFGGATYKNSLIPVPEEGVGANILRTEFASAICKYLGIVRLNDILDEYFNTFNHEMSSFAGIIQTSPEEWEISDETKQRIENFVLDSGRNESVYEQMKAFFNHFN